MNIDRSRLIFALAYCLLTHSCFGYVDLLKTFEYVTTVD